MERARGLEAESHQEQLKDLAYPGPEIEKAEGRQGSRLPALEGLSKKPGPLPRARGRTRRRKLADQFRVEGISRQDMVGPPASWYCKGLQLLKLSNQDWAGLVWDGLRIPPLGRGAGLEDLRGHS